MKKQLTWCILLFVVLAIHAQENNIIRYKKWTITPRIGIAIANYTGSDIENNKVKIGPTIGIEAEKRISSHIGLSSGLFYTEQGFTDKTEYILLQKIYCDPQIYTFVGEIPTQAYWEDCLKYFHYSHQRTTLYMMNIPFTINTHIHKGLTIKVGIQADIILDAIKRKDCNGLYYEDSKRHIVSEEQKDNVHNDYRFISASLPIGISYEYRHFELDARYLAGVTNLSKRQGNFRNNTFLITLGYQL